MLSQLIQETHWHHSFSFTFFKISKIFTFQIKKLEEAIRKCENNVNNMKKKYEEKLSRIGPLNSSYEKEMRNVYDKWAKDEEKRKDFMQRLLVDYHKCVNIHEDSRWINIFRNCSRTATFQLNLILKQVNKILVS